MNAITPKKNTFGRYDRICIGPAAYRYVRKDEDGAHQLQLTRDGLLEDSYLRITDKKIAELQRRKNFKVEPAYFAKAVDEMRARHDNTDLLALSEEDARTVLWKMEWCVRFHDARLSPSSAFRPNMTPEDLKTFIDNEKVAINRWYIRRFGEARPIGRPVVMGFDANGDEIREHKPFDFPSPTALRNWLRLYARTGDRMAALAPRYHRCGNRKQLDTEYSKIIDKCVLHYADRSLPTRKDILDRVEVELYKLRKKRKEPLKLVSQSTVDRRIAKLEPFYVAVGRLGEDRAMRRYQLVGRGVEALYPMHRVEMDDWEVDLMTLLIDAGTWKRMDEEQRAEVKRTRCIVTAAIDVKTRCIVGINVSESTPSTPAAKAALRSITLDKTKLARDCGAKATWEMHGRLNGLFTDGGPVFMGEFREAARNCGADYTRPDPDPRQRGHIEAFFRYLRRFCRFFTGQTFSNIVVKNDYPAEKFASLTVEEFRKALIRFIVDIYHNTERRGLARMTPRAAWERDTAKHPPDELTAAQRLYAFGFKHPGVRLDNNGVVYLDIRYNSAALGEMVMKLGNGKKLKDGLAVANVDLVIDPENLGQIFVQIPREHIAHMQAFAPIAMHGAFLEVPAVDRRFEGRTLARRLAANEGVRAFVRQAKLKGDVIRIEANESLTLEGQMAAERAGVASHLLTADTYAKVVRRFRRKAKQSTEQDPIPDEPTPQGEGGLGTLVAAGKRTKAAPKPPKPIDDYLDALDPTVDPPVAPPPEAAPDAPEEPRPVREKRPAATKQQQGPAPVTGRPRPSRSINQGDDD